MWISVGPMASMIVHVRVAGVETAYAHLKLKPTDAWAWIPVWIVFATKVYPCSLFFPWHGFGPVSPRTAAEENNVCWEGGILPERTFGLTQASCAHVDTGNGMLRQATWHMACALYAEETWCLNPVWTCLNHFGSFVLRDRNCRQ